MRFHGLEPFFGFGAARFRLFLLFQKQGFFFRQISFRGFQGFFFRAKGLLALRHFLHGGVSGGDGVFLAANFFLRLLYSPFRGAGIGRGGGKGGFGGIGCRFLFVDGFFCRHIGGIFQLLFQRGLVFFRAANFFVHGIDISRLFFFFI